MNLVYVLQVGNDGPITVGTSTDRGWTRKLRSLQDAHWQIVTVTHLLDGDEHLERRIHVEIAEHRIRGDWYRPDALPAIEALEIPRLPHDQSTEGRRQAMQQLRDLTTTDATQREALHELRTLARRPPET